MNCYYHEERVATATCQGCGRSLCSECASAIDIPICKNCLSLHIQGEKSKMIKTIVIGIILGIACSCFIESPSGLMFAWVPFGWMALSAITPKIFLVLPVVGWVVYFIVKFVLSFFIGWIALPIKLYQWFRIITAANRILG